MNTQQIMQLANELAGFDQTPADSAIYFPGDNIKKILIGIDMGVPELMIARELGYDLVIAHHPVANPGKHIVYHRHTELMMKYGVSRNEAEKAVAAGMEAFELADHVTNHDHVRSFAELLRIPFMNIHQACDEIGRRILQDAIDQALTKDPEATLVQVAEAIGQLPEFKTASTRIAIRMGEPGAKAGKTVMAHGALTNGGYEVADAYFRAGVNTVVYIHIHAPAFNKLRDEAKGNLIVTGHIASDEVGINPLINALEERGMKVDPVSGLCLKRRRLA